MTESIQRAEGRLLECIRGVRLKREPGHLVVYRISQSSHVAHDRGCTVALCPHLGKATRLVQRWHEKEVGTRHESMFEPISEVQLDSDTIGRGGGQLH